MTIKQLNQDLNYLGNDILVIKFYQSYISCRAEARVISKSSSPGNQYVIAKARNLIALTRLLNQELINEDTQIIFKCFFKYDYTFKDNTLTITNY